MSEGKPTSRKGKLVLLIGPSGVGKSVILRELRKRHPDWHFPRSATTRKRRPGEGEELYHFVTETEFDALLKEGKLLEWARVHEGARYGTLLEEIIPPIEAGSIVVREVDVQGFESIRSHPLFRRSADLSAAAQGVKVEASAKAGDGGASYTLQSIFILPESAEQLVARIKKRAPIGEEELQKRIASMERELAAAALCDARVVNREGALEGAVRAVEAAI